ncbi:unnamed protein product, partial [Ascophyllum nodosum]
ALGEACDFAIGCVEIRSGAQSSRGEGRWNEREVCGKEVAEVGIGTRARDDVWPPDEVRPSQQGNEDQKRWDKRSAGPLREQTPSGAQSSYQGQQAHLRRESEARDGYFRC